MGASECPPPLLPQRPKKSNVYVTPALHNFVSSEGDSLRGGPAGLGV